MIKSLRIAAGIARVISLLQESGPNPVAEFKWPRVLQSIQSASASIARLPVSPLTSRYFDAAGRIARIAVIAGRLGEPVNSTKRRPSAAPSLGSIALNSTGRSISGLRTMGSPFGGGYHRPNFSRRDYLSVTS
jgi:hypothetical protein